MSSAAHVDPETAAEFAALETIEDMRECAKLVTMGGTAARFNDACLLAFTDCDAALAMFREADEIPSASFSELVYLRHVVLNHIMQIKATRTKTNEKLFSKTDLQRHFFANLHEYLPGAVKVKHKTTKGHKPDGFICLDGETMPVEAKLGVFNNKALEQLEWYMRIYGMGSGIAVAQELRCALPHNVRFVKIDAADLL